ncbi:hypothetical protein VC83_06386 [Pseudogymnoascus destructans]|uniref:Uncharacterized protein n=2 Tax=Pseudogymnoascus destructans TaxID=655981 RepID=L8GA76_PSED2|nr:uncharacterized protein VC83_06386 [Pseudogymnoascus destructans]ELR09987.1 hypothetical protein GMDG_00745 [Pseudogymnoascus destructans 20631-21]OAF58187.1 hypothetical protein VC83_06386 [Pseudogymnoascus destructans]
MGVICRKRKYASSSSLEDFDPITGACSVEKFAASKDAFRVAPTLKLPIPMPYDSKRCSAKVRDITEVLFDSIIEAAGTFGISCQTIEVHHMWQRGFPQTAGDTIILSTLDVIATRWEAAANYILGMVEEAVVDIEFRIEIRNPDLMYSDISMPIRDREVCKVLTEIAPPFEAEVERSCPSLWTSIACHSRRRYDAYEDPGNATIVLFIEPKSVSLWGLIEERLREVMESVQSAREFNISLEILPGFNIPAVTPSEEMLEESARYQGRVPASPANGASIGPRVSTTRSGSIGPVVYFKAHDKAEPQKGILTCHHVISSGDPQGRRDNDRLGIGLNGSKVNRRIDIDWPSRQDIDYTKKRLDEDILKGKDKNGELASMRTSVTSRFTPTTSIGHVAFSSGMRLNDSKTRMDWALIILTSPGPGDAIENVLPLRSAFGDEFEVPGFENYKVGPGHKVSDIHELMPGSWVAKKGRTTGITVGEVGEKKRVVHWKNGMKSMEFEAFTYATGIKQFAEPGDSGSMAFDLQGAWVGMVIGMDSLKECGYVTSAGELIADIEAKTKGKITLG